MPSLSPTMESGTIASWNVSEGETFAAGDVLCEVETDKASVAFEAQDEGVVAKILASAGPDDIKCGVPIMVVVEEEDDVAAFQDFVPESTADAPVEEPTPAPPAPAPVVEAPTSAAPVPAAAPVAPSGGRVVASPLAWTVAKEKGLDLSSIAIVGTGPGGRIIADDVREYVPVAMPVADVAASAAAAVTTATSTASTTAPPPVVGSGFTDYPLSPAAMEIASQLTASKQSVPHYYLTVDVTLDNIMQLRETLNASLALKEGDAGISLNDLIVKASAHAMKACPTANASWMDTAVRVYDKVDVNVVIGNGDSLYAPVLRDVGSKGVKSISEQITSAVHSLEEGTTDQTFNEVGTVTVMNLGMYGVKSCAPIIRQPQAVALAVGAAETRIVPNDDPDSEQIYKESLMLTATLSCDHRVVDGAVGAQWLASFKTSMENPTQLLL